MRGQWQRLIFVWGLMGFLVACRSNVPAGNTSSDILFSDSFTAGTIGPWLLESDDQGQAIIADGRLVITLDALNLVQYVALPDLNFSDFVLSVDVSQTAGDPDSTYGLLWRMNGPNQFYRFDITSTGLYLIERHNSDGTLTNLSSSWQPSSILFTGLNVINHLQVEAIATRTRFYVNDQFLYEMSDGGYQQGNIALDAGTFRQGDLQVTFDNVLVSAPK